ncbi:MAG: hypothetical protein U5J98_02565 [Halobacteriales archaeon]|nr:hypothetical protein [Halobacteriales archaeon]
MFDDPWPEEPDDPFPDPGDPESRFDLTIPDGADAPTGLQRAFWGLVAVFNVALFAAALGALLIAFRGQWDLGGSLLAAGAVLFGYGVYRYRRLKAGGFQFESADD